MSSTNKQQLLSTSWKCSEVTSEVQLRLYNNLSKKKEVFIPINGNEVRWYTCGQSLYDTIHLDHVRFYMSLDILRRIMQNYFGYDITYCMDINDIDDKIIERIRDPNLKIDLTHAKQILEDYQLSLEYLKDIGSSETNEYKRTNLNKQGSSADNSFGNINHLSTDKYEPKKSFDNDIDFLPSYSESSLSFPTTNPFINKRYLALGRQKEQKFSNLMEQLDILPPNIGIRASDYIHETINFIEKIFANGYAYESNSSVYFNKLKFDQQHSCEKTQPDRIDVVAGSNEEKTSNGKKNESDFILWKRTGVPDEPSWQSPWGLGQPGSNIYRGIMASMVLGSQFDIFAGKIDRKNPHHHHEIAQSTAYYMDNSWVKYSFHIDDLTIDGHKMTPSLNNIVTTEQVLAQFSSRQIRLLLLIHLWSSTFDFNEEEMKKATNYEKIFMGFFGGIKHILCFLEQSNVFDPYTKFSEHDLTLNKRFSEIKKQIHLALSDSIDTSTVLEKINQLISTTNIYMDEPNIILNGPLLRDIVDYITRLLTIFGLNFSALSVDDTELTESIEQQSSTVKDAVHAQATDFRNKETLTLSDHAIHEILPESSVQFEDQDVVAETNKMTIQFCDSEMLKHERE